MVRTSLFACSLLLVTTTASASRPSTAEVQQTITTLHMLVNTGAPLPSSVDEAQVRELLGAMHYRLNQHKKAEQEWTRLLVRFPTHEFSSDVYPRAMTRRFERLRDRLVQTGTLSKSAPELLVPRARRTPDHKPPTERELRIPMGSSEFGGDRYRISLSRCLRKAP